VTNDLYREFRKAQSCYVRKVSIIGSSFEPEAKSLFQKILSVSPYASIFCSPREIPASASHLQSGFYPLTTKKMLGVFKLTGPPTTRPHRLICVEAMLIDFQRADLGIQS
jgi:hypothetical protein